MQERLEKLRNIENLSGSPYSTNRFLKEGSIADIKQEFFENKEVSSAGRVITKREHGKSVFFDIKDSSGKIQAYLRKDLVGEDKFSLFKETDIGDIVGLSGSLFKTRTEEITIAVKDFTILSKSLHNMPEKWHGLKDVELRFRKRYLDLIANDDSVDTFVKRAKIVRIIRSFLDSRKFIEVETPMLHSIAGGAAGRPFKTHHNALNLDIYLRIAPELYLKRILVGGFDQIYEINRSFRNEGLSVKHNPEFTMLEVYSAYNNYSYMVELTESLLKMLAKEISGTGVINYQGNEIDFSKPFKKLSLADKLKDDFGVEHSDSQEVFVKKMAERLNLNDKTNLSRSQIINLIEDLVEEKYYGKEPIFVTDFYTWMSPLAKAKKNNPYIAERFELFISGIEVANAYSELNDPIEQKKRLIQQGKTDDEFDKRIDDDFIEALEYGMPPATGLGIGIDRLTMILLNKSSIKEVILFPLLRPADA